MELNFLKAMYILHVVVLLLASSLEFLSLQSVLVSFDDKSCPSGGDSCNPQNEIG